MTPLQEAYLNKLHATAAANLEFFKLNLPVVYYLLVHENPGPSLDISDQGDLTIRFPDGSSKPVASYIVDSEKRFAEFADLDTRPQILAFHNLRAVEENPSHGDMQRYHYTNLDADFPNRMRRHFSEHYPDNTRLNRYPVFSEEKQIPLLIVLGSGVGAHLSRLVLEYDARHLIVMEPDVDTFRISLFFQDYVQLSRLANEKNTDLAFIVGSNIAHLSTGLMDVLRRSLPPFFVHGAALFYAMPQGEILEELKSSITETLWQLFFGLGYFDDEFISVKHTFQNLADQLPVYTRPWVVGEEAVAFVVGSGPSLDGLLPLLQEYQDRSVIFSCGTALGPLCHAGIQPDFHLEKERPGIVLDVLTRTVPAEFLKRISFLGLNVVMPEVFELFGKVGMVLKEADTMGAVLEHSGQVGRVPLNTQPTVTNMAVSVALSMGFRCIYLIGVDMGYKEKEQHHSKHTAYLGKMPEADHLRRLLSKRPSREKTVPGNFGGEVTTNNILEMSRLHLEYTLRPNTQARVYNLNDGALIDGAIPLPQEDFPGSLLGFPEPAAKVEAMTAMRGAFDVIDFDLGALGQVLMDDVDRFMEECSALLENKRTRRWEVIDAIVSLYQVLAGEEARRTPVACLFRGSLLMLLSLSYNAISIIADEDEAVAKADYDFGVVADFLEAARTELKQVLAGAVA